MTTLTIQDLAHTEALDRKALSAVRGGMGRYQPSCGWMPCFPGYPSYDDSRRDTSLTATQNISQNQQVFNVNGNNAAFVGGIESTVKPVQTANNSIVGF